MEYVYSLVSRGKVLWLGICPEEDRTEDPELRHRREVDRAMKVLDWAQGWSDTLRRFQEEQLRQEAQAMLEEQCKDSDWDAYILTGPVSMREANRAVREHTAPRRCLSIQVDIGRKTVAVSGWRELNNMELKLSWYGPYEVTRAIRDNALAIGFGLGTILPSRTRAFRPPWAKIQECLKTPDPVGSLEQAAAEDKLRGKLHIMGEELERWADTGWLSTSRTGSLHLTDVVIGIYVPGEGRGGVPATLFFRTERDGRQILLLPPMGQVEGLELTGGLKEFVRKVAQDKSLLRNLSKLAAAVRMMDGVAFYETPDEQSQAALLHAYGTQILDDGTGAVLPGTGLEMDWPLLRSLLNFQFYKNHEKGRLEDGLTGDSHILLRSPGGNWCVGNMQELCEEVRGALDASRTGLTGLPDRHRFCKLLFDRIDEALAPEMSVYLADRVCPGAILRGTLKWNGFAFSVCVEDEPCARPLDDLRESGSVMSARYDAVRRAMEDMGRTPVEPALALQDLDEFAEQSVQHTARRAMDNSDLAEELSLLTVPAGWGYVAARFRDGRIGVAYGPLQAGETGETCRPRLYAQAADLPSEEALYLF